MTSAVLVLDNRGVDITITVTEKEANQLAAICDTAVRAAGLACAETALAIVRKLRDAQEKPVIHGLPA